MAFDDLFEPAPDPIAWLINIRTGASYDVYIGRGSIWGNPYSHLAVSAAEFQVRTRDEAIDSYRTYILNRPDLLAQLHTLCGKILGCWCVPKRCHGHVLIELLYGLAKGAPGSTSQTKRGGTESYCDEEKENDKGRSHI